MTRQSALKEIIEMDGDSPPSRLAAFTDGGGTMAAPLAEWVQNYAEQVREAYFEYNWGLETIDDFVGFLLGGELAATDVGAHAPNAAFQLGVAVGALEMLASSFGVSVARLVAAANHPEPQITTPHDGGEPSTAGAV